MALQDYQRLLASQSVRRLNPAKLSESAALKNKLVDTIAFLESMAVKDSNEKDLFFKRLPATLPSLPLPVVQKKVSPGALLLMTACCLLEHIVRAPISPDTGQLQALMGPACNCSCCPCWQVHWSLGAHRRWHWERCCRLARLWTLRHSLPKWYQCSPSCSPPMTAPSGAACWNPSTHMALISLR